MGMYDDMGPPIDRPMFAFVTGHGAPVACPTGARYVRRHSDGSVMEASGPEDTVAACEARWKAAQKPTSKPAKKTAAPAAKED